MADEVVLRVPLSIGRDIIMRVDPRHESVSVFGARRVTGFRHFSHQSGSMVVTPVYGAEAEGSDGLYFAMMLDPDHVECRLERVRDPRWGPMAPASIKALVIGGELSAIIPSVQIDRKSYSGKPLPLVGKKAKAA
ncbi:MAG: hypothetical protein AAB691_02725 [Patescibacteria group bacterium]